MSGPERHDVSSFLQRFEQVGAADTDAAEVAELFCDVFLNLDPNAATPVPRDAMAKALPMRKQLFDTIGVSGAELVESVQIPLDELHVLVRTTWRARFADTAPSREPLMLRSDFLLRREAGQWCVAVYLNHQDIAAVIRERSSASDRTR